MSGEIVRDATGTGSDFQRAHRLGARGKFEPTLDLDRLEPGRVRVEHGMRLA